MGFLSNWGIQCASFIYVLWKDMWNKRTCLSLCSLVTIHYFWWTDVLKLRNALPVKCMWTTGMNHLAFPWLSSFSWGAVGMCRESVLNPRSCISITLPTLLLLWLDSHWMWAGIYMWEITLCRIIFLLIAFWDFSFTVCMLITCKTCLWYIQLYFEKWIVTYDSSVWKISFILSALVMSIQIWKLY